MTKYLEIRNYTVSFYNVNTGNQSFVDVRACSAEDAIAKARGTATDFHFTRNFQNDTDEGLRDNAHAQRDEGRIGWAACRAGLESKYFGDQWIAK